MKLKITILPGDGVGPEVIEQALRVLKAVEELYDHKFEFDEKPVGGAAIRQAGSPLPVATLDACLQGDAVLLGAVGSPEYDALAPNERPEAGLLNLRRALGGYANLRPAISYRPIMDCSPLRASVIEGADILIVRELLGGLYFGEPRRFLRDAEDGASAFNTMRYSAEEIERVARVAFVEARRRRRKVTSVDKANVLETSQLWREVVTRVSKDYADITLDHLYVDACAMHLMMNPRKFDVLLTENLFGDILSDEAAAITGSLGMLASASIGGAVDLYEPVHGSAPDIAGRGLANPLGAIASAAMLLRHTACLEQEAQDIEEAILTVLEARHRTQDLDRGSSGRSVVTTFEMGSLVADALAEIADRRFAYHAV
jgi:3-isopropylmalate dehydrogenase